MRDEALERFKKSVEDLKDSIDAFKAKQSRNFIKWGILDVIIIGFVQVSITLLLK